MFSLFDGDIAVFRCGMAAERRSWFIKTNDGTKEFEYKKEAIDYLDKVLPGKHSRKEGKDYEMWSEVNLEPLSHALSNVKSLVNKCLRETQCNEFDLKMYLSPVGKTFRHKLAVTRPYKGNRDKSHRPTYEQEIRDFIVQNYDTTIAEDEEADDLLGIAQTKYGPHDSVIVTLDKDLDQVPGLKYNYMHDVAYEITPKEAVYNFHMQLMTGDTTDNIVGLPGIGPGKAAKALHGLETPEEQMEEVIRMYQLHSGKEDWKEYLTEMGRLVYIRRQPGEMWEPPQINDDAVWNHVGGSLYGEE